jgi:hypothetical protein
MSTLTEINRKRILLQNRIDNILLQPMTAESDLGLQNTMRELQEINRQYDLYAPIEVRKSVKMEIV